MGLLLKGWHWGDIRGLIHLTGSEALEEFGFSTKVGATGIMFRRYPYVTSGGKRKIGTFINNFVPRVDPHTAAQNVNRRDRFGVLSSIVNAHRDPFYNIWQPLAENRHYHKAMWRNEFTGVNMRLIGTPPDFNKMLLSDGKLEPTQQVTGVAISPPPWIITITFDSGTYQNGRPTDVVHAAIFSDSLKTLEIPTDTQTWLRRDLQYQGTLAQAYLTSDIIAFIWFSRENMYSPSVSLHGT